MAKHWVPIVVAGSLTVGCESSSPSGPTEPVDLLWIRPIGIHAQSPQAADGRVIYSDSGAIVALDLRSGELLWVAEIGFFRVGPDFLAAPEAVYVEGPGGELVALDAETGDRLWEVAGCDCLPLARDQARVFAVHEGRILAFHSTGGALAWNLALPRPGWPLLELAVGRGVVCVGQNESDITVLACLDTAQGELRWQDLAQEREALTALDVTEGIVVAGTVGAGLMAFDLESGAPVWQADLSDADAHVELDAADDLVFACTEDVSFEPLSGAVCVALRAADGFEVWRRAIEGEPTEISAAEELLLIVVSGELVALDRSTGEQVLRLTSKAFGSELAGSTFHGRPAHENGIVALRHSDAIVGLRLP